MLVSDIARDKLHDAGVILSRGLLERLSLHEMEECVLGMQASGCPRCHFLPSQRQVL
jgi:hypothetical protein